MDDKNAGKDSKDPAETTEATEGGGCGCKLRANWKIIAGVLVVVIILLNTFWNMMETKISYSVTSVTNEVGAVKTELVNFDARLSEAEKGATLDTEAVKADIAAIKRAGENFEKRLNAVITAEEGKLALLEKDVANQKAYIDELKSLLE
ncbi:MAG: hypothetical protein FWG71_00680 [Synergistaceae bacterium]|nr:hypothetical protein [Synergistaceae bacterium]